MPNEGELEPKAVVVAAGAPKGFAAAGAPNGLAAAAPPNGLGAAGWAAPKGFAAAAPKAGCAGAPKGLLCAGAPKADGCAAPNAGAAEAVPKGEAVEAGAKGLLAPPKGDGVEGCAPKTVDPAPKGLDAAGATVPCVSRGRREFQQKREPAHRRAEGGDAVVQGARPSGGAHRVALDALRVILVPNFLVRLLGRLELLHGAHAHEFDRLRLLSCGAGLLVRHGHELEAAATGRGGGGGAESAGGCAAKRGGCGRGAETRRCGGLRCAEAETTLLLRRGRRGCGCRYGSDGEG